MNLKSVTSFDIHINFKPFKVELILWNPFGFKKIELI